MLGGGGNPESSMYSTGSTGSAVSVQSVQSIQSVQTKYVEVNVELTVKQWIGR